MTEWKPIRRTANPVFDLPDNGQQTVSVDIETSTHHPIEWRKYFAEEIAAAGLRGTFMGPPNSQFTESNTFGFSCDEADFEDSVTKVDRSISAANARYIEVDLPKVRARAAELRNRHDAIEERRQALREQAERLNPPDA